MALVSCNITTCIQAVRRGMKRHSFRQAALVLTVVGLLLFPASVASAGGQPTRTPLPAIPFVYPAGQACNFALGVTPLVNDEVIKEFPPQSNGDVVIKVNGHLVIALTNEGTQKSITTEASGPLTLTFHADGTEAVDARGTGLLVLFPGDTPAGPQATVVSGHFVLTLLSPNGPGVLQSLSGHQLDVCAALS